MTTCFTLHHQSYWKRKSNEERKELSPVLASPEWYIDCSEEKGTTQTCTVGVGTTVVWGTVQ